ncbi:ATP-binding protein [Myxococcota bacterium]|nr:ATP-binding protein [Myxococcota bacterium]
MRSPVLVLDPDLRLVAVTDAYLAATMTDRAAILGHHLFEVFPDNPDDPHANGVANLAASLRRVIASRRPDAMAVQKYDIRRPAAQGGGFEVRYWSPVNTPVLDDEGRLLYILHEVTDVTDFVLLQAAEAEAHRQAEKLLARNAGMEAEIIARGIDLMRVNAELRQAHADLERRVEERTAALHKTEEQLRHAQRLESIGRLAGGVAHDFNNLLTVILSMTELVRAELHAQDPRAEDLGQVLAAGKRAAALTSQLLAFSRQQLVETRVFELDPVVVQMGRMLRPLLGEDIELTILVQAAGACVRADLGQVEQVIANLVVNARDAMPGGGRLTLETGCVELGEDYAREHVGAQVGPHLMLACSDSGHGMSRDVQARIFEPFFTTKPQGKGTGLGLSTVFGIVKQAGGSVWVYSEPDQGTTFKVYLPQVAQAPDRPVARGAPPPLRPGSEAVLLVEDDDMVRGVATAILRGHGYRVRSFAAPVEALSALEADPRSVDLLITDLVMPGMNGRELAERAALLRPDLKVLYLSGYTDDAVVRSGVLTADLRFLQKPFTPDTMARRVREVLDGG